MKPGVILKNARFIISHMDSKNELCQPTITSHNQLTLWPSYPPGWSPFHLVRFRHASGSTTACRCKPLLCDTETLESFFMFLLGRQIEFAIHWVKGAAYFDNLMMILLG